MIEAGLLNDRPVELLDREMIEMPWEGASESRSQVVWRKYGESFCILAQVGISTIGAE